MKQALIAVAAVLMVVGLVLYWRWFDPLFHRDNCTCGRCKWKAEQ